MQTLERPDLLLTALGFACFAFLGPASGSTTFYGPPLFVASTLANSVAVIDSAANQVTTAIPVGRSPTRISLSPNGMKVHVSNTGSNTVSVIDTLNRIATATIRTGHSGPEELTVTRDGGCDARLKQFSL